ncbi:MAG: methyltransferase [Jatrophihabitans sp.]|nr:methyltransferase [Jatrophihabitans sp.]
MPVTGAEDARWSAISSADDLYLRPNDDLVAVLLAAAERARAISLTSLEARSDPAHARWVRRWPGEHYRLLAALVATLQPATVVEIGTFKGHGALALAAGSSATKVITYDVVPWPEFADTALRASDLDGGQLEQRLGDLGDPAYLREQLVTLRSADLLFIDGPKDGVWEQHALAPILAALTDRRRLVILDDIRLLELVQLWRDLPFAKLDATSLGHWSGTGLLHTA